jgi:hypothetical protein
VRGHRGGALLAIVTALVIGIAIGLVVAGGNSDEGADAQLARIETERDGLRARLRTAEGRVADLTERVKDLGAQGAVPSFVGKQIAEIEADRSVRLYRWRIRTRDRFSARTPGTVLRQLPPGGTTLRAGRSIALFVAKKAPLRPRRWVTIRTLTGAGVTRTREFTVAGGAGARLVYDMPQNAHNTIVLYRVGQAVGNLLLNVIGPRHGVTRLHEPGRFYLEVTGRYTIRVQVLRRPR